MLLHRLICVEIMHLYTNIWRSPFTFFSLKTMKRISRTWPKILIKRSTVLNKLCLQTKGRDYVLFLFCFGFFLRLNFYSKSFKKIWTWEDLGANVLKHNIQDACVPLVVKMGEIYIFTSLTLGLIVNRHE